MLALERAKVDRDTRFPKYLELCKTSLPSGKSLDTITLLLIYTEQVFLRATPVFFVGPETELEE